MDINPNKPVILDAGEEVRFVVDVHAFPDSNSVILTWFHNGIEINHLDKHHKIGTSKNGEALQAFLVINKADVSDCGNFTLMGNTTDMMTQITVMLYVRGQAIAKVMNSQDYYLLGQTYNIQCLSIGYPKGKVWWKWIPCFSLDNCSNDWIDLNADKIEMLNSDKLIHINESEPYLSRLDLNLKANQSGVYRCFAQNMNLQANYKQIPFIVSGMMILI